MTLIELMTFVGAIAGAILGSRLGHSHFGTMGMVLGGIIGLIVGAIVACSGIELIEKLGIELERRRQRRDLTKIFGKFWLPEKSCKWNEEKRNVEIGEQVVGKVVAKYYYGVFIDIGRGFPALLTKLYWNEAMQTVDPDIGAQVKASVREVDTRNRYFNLTAKPLDGEIGRRKGIK